MSDGRDVARRCLIAVLVMLVVAPIAGSLLPNTPFHRVMTRVLQTAVVVVFLVGAGRIRNWPRKLKGYGFVGPFRMKRVLFGAAVGAALFLLLLAVSYFLDGRVAQDRTRIWLGYRILKAAVAGVMVALFEEFLFRGFLKDRIGGIVSALLYGAIHYFQPLASSAPAPKGYHPFLAWERLGVLFESWTDLRQVSMGIGSLFLFGLALNRMRDRTGSLYLGIGVHGGLVFMLASYRHFLTGHTTGNIWIHGGTRVHDGVLGVVALAVLWALACWAPLPRFARRPD